MRFLSKPNEEAPKARQWQRGKGCRPGSFWQCAASKPRFMKGPALLSDAHSSNLAITSTNQQSPLPGMMLTVPSEASNWLTSWTPLHWLGCRRPLRRKESCLFITDVVYADSSLHKSKVEITSMGLKSLLFYDRLKKKFSSIRKKKKKIGLTLYF